MILACFDKFQVGDQGKYNYFHYIKVIAIHCNKITIQMYVDIYSIKDWFRYYQHLVDVWYEEKKVLELETFNEAEKWMHKRSIHYSITADIHL